MTLTAKRLLGMLAALILLIVIGLGILRLSHGTDDGRAVLRVGVLKGGTRPLVEAAGVLQDAPYRVEWVEFPSGQPMLEAMGAGAIDLGTTGDTAFQYAYQAGRPLVIVLAERAEDVTGASGILVPPNSPIHSARDLKGRIIGTTRGSAGHLLILRALAEAHLAPSDVRFAFLTPADGKAALQSGAIDAWAIWPPYIGAALLEHSARIAVDGRGLVRNYLFQVASRDAASRRKGEIADYLKRHEAARRWVLAHPQPAAAALARDGGLPLPVARYTLERQHWRSVPLDDDLVSYQRGLAETLAGAGVFELKHDVGAGFPRY
ncbi:MAG TPA: ABC transporter substrate-binding protein [Sphingobium sp.]|uniref:ABC transporter substrate-binding protein n=1 Tax=Sphingobium sp. TaxID=1912891 RepID=UPI002ED25944